MKRLFAIVLTLAMLCVCGQAESLFDRNMRLKERAQQIVNLIYDGEYEAVAAEFSDQMAEMADADDVKALWEGMQPHLGAFVERKNVSCSIVQGYADVTVRDEFEHYMLEVGIVFDGQDRIYGIDMYMPDFVQSGSGIAVPDEATTQFLMEESLRLCDALLAGDYGKIVSRLSEDIIGTLSEEQIADTWTKMAPLMGEYVQRGEIQAAIGGEYLVILVPEEFSERTLNVQFVWDGRSELMGFHFRANFDADELPQ